MGVQAVARFGRMTVADVIGDNEEIAAGVEWLARTQRADGTWHEEPFTGTGFPKVFYLKYHLYALYFPLMALARYDAALHSGGASPRFKGYTDFVVQDLVLRPHVTRFRCERWLTPNGTSVTAPLPDNLSGHFGPGLQRFVIMERRLFGIEYWKTEANAAEGNPMLMLERGEKVELPRAIWLQGRPDPLHDYHDPDTDFPGTESERFVSYYRRAGGDIELIYFERANRDVSALLMTREFLRKAVGAR